MQLFAIRIFFVLVVHSCLVSSNRELATTSFTCAPYSATNTNSAQQNYATCYFATCAGATSTTVTVSGCGCTNDQYLSLWVQSIGGTASSSSTATDANDDSGSCGTSSCSQIIYNVPSIPTSAATPCATYYIREGCYQSSSCSGTVVVSGITSATLPINFYPSASYPTGADLTRSNLLGAVALPAQYTVSFDLYPTADGTGYRNIMQLTADGKDLTSRLPAVLFCGDSNLCPTLGLHVAHTASALPQNSALDAMLNTARALPVTTWSTVTITIDATNLLMTLTVTGGISIPIASTSFPTPSQQTWPSVQIFASNPWYSAGSAKIRNLIISPAISTGNCCTASENGQCSLVCDTGTVVTGVSFASYGTPTGSCPSGQFSTSSCNLAQSSSLVSAACLGKQSCSVNANNAFFVTDPCAYVSKSLAIKVRCAAPATLPISYYPSSSYSSGFTLVQSNMVGVVALPSAYTVTVDLYPTADGTTERNVLTLTSTGGDWPTGAGSYIPSIRMCGTGGCCPNQGVSASYIGSGSSNSNERIVFTSQRLPLSQWSTVSVTIDTVNLLMILSVSGAITVPSISMPVPTPSQQAWSSVLVYATSPWGDTPAAKIRNLGITSLSATIFTPQPLPFSYYPVSTFRQGAPSYRGNFLGVVALPAVYTITFSVYVVALPTFWVNIFHLTSTGQDQNGAGSRLPAVEICDPVSCSQGGMGCSYIASGTGADWSGTGNERHLRTPLQASSWAQVSITIDTNAKQMTFTLDSTTQSTSFPTPQQLTWPNVQVFASDPFSCATITCNIGNLVISSPRPTSLPSMVPSISPTRDPTRLPSAFPIANPTPVPSQFPTAFPTTFRPSPRPTLLPTAVPTLRPSPVPPGPTAPPSTLPTAPSALPSLEPTTLPTARPTLNPTGQPTRQPSRRPTGQPIGHPSGQPTSQPSRRPSRQPSGRPTRRPSGQPTNMPTSPSGQPTSRPSANPSWAACKAGSQRNPRNKRCVLCSAGSFSDKPDSICQLCSVGTFASKSGQTACESAPPGFFASSPGAVTAALCNPGYFSVGQASTCSPCPPGSYESSSGGDSCSPCAVGTYSSVPGSLACIQCPSGRVTPRTGASSESQCLSPAVNFAMGFLTLVLAFVLGFLYVIRGRFHFIAFLRRERVVKLLVVLYNQFCSNVKAAQIKLQDEFNEGLQVSETRHVMNTLTKNPDEFQLTWRKWKYLPIPSDYQLREIAKTLVFAIISSFVLIAATLVQFCLLTSNVLFKALLVQRQSAGAGGMKSGSFVAILDNTKQAVLSVLSSVTLLRNIFGLLLTLVNAVLAFLSSIRIDLSGLGITCDGSIAPFQLVFNVLALGATIIVIESDILTFRATAFAKALEAYKSRLLSREYLRQELNKLSPPREGNAQGEDAQWWQVWGWFAKHLLYVSFYFAVTFAANQLDLQVALQYLISLVKLRDFTRADGVHSHSDNCDKVPGALGFDSFLAIMSTIAAFALMFPAIYEVAKIICPFEETRLKDQRPSTPQSSGNRISVFPENSSASNEQEGTESPRRAKCISLPWVRWVLLPTTLFSPDLLLLQLARGLLACIDLRHQNSGAPAQSPSIGEGTGQSPSDSERPSEASDRMQGIDNIDTDRLFLNNALSFVYNATKTTIETALRPLAPVTSVVKDDWDRERTEALLPSYYRLVQREVYELSGGNPEFEPDQKKRTSGVQYNPIAHCMAFMLILFPFGHFITNSGFKSLQLVVLKYCLFARTTLGYWNRRTETAYNVPKKMIMMQTVIDESNFAAFGLTPPSQTPTQRPLQAAPIRRIPRTSTPVDQEEEEMLMLSEKEEIQRLLDKDSECVAYSSLLSVTIGSRAVLLQLVPYFITWSLFAVATSGLPLFVTRPNPVEDNKDPNIKHSEIRTARLYDKVGGQEEYVLSPMTCWRRASLRLAGTAVENRHWLRFISAVSIFLLESRLINWAVQVYMVILAILIGYGTAETDQRFLALSIIVLLPVALGRSLNLVVSLGKVFDVHDLWRLAESDRRVKITEIWKRIKDSGDEPTLEAIIAALKQVERKEFIRRYSSISDNGKIRDSLAVVSNESVRMIVLDSLRHSLVAGSRIDAQPHSSGDINSPLTARDTTLFQAAGARRGSALGSISALQANPHQRRGSTHDNVPLPDSSPAETRTASFSHTTSLPRRPPESSRLNPSDDLEL